MNRSKALCDGIRLTAALAVIVGLSGCIGLVLGGAAGGASIVTDQRTAGTMVEDEAIELKAGNLLRDDAELKQQAHINVTSYNEIVLVTGEAPTEAMRARIVDKIKSVAKVRNVHNEMVIAAPSPLTARTTDSWLTTSVKTKLIASKGLNATKVKVVTESGVVYLLGLVTQTEGNLAAEISSQTAGVQRVIKLFEYR